MTHFFILTPSETTKQLRFVSGLYWKSLLLDQRRVHLRDGQQVLLVARWRGYRALRSGGVRRFSHGVISILDTRRFWQNETSCCKCLSLKTLHVRSWNRLCFPTEALLASKSISSDAEFAGSIFPSSKIARSPCRSPSWPGGNVTHLWTAMRKLSHPYSLGQETFVSFAVWNAADGCSISPIFGHILGVSFGPRPSRASIHIHSLRSQLRPDLTGVSLGSSERMPLGAEAQHIWTRQFLLITEDQETLLCTWMWSLDSKWFICDSKWYTHIYI